MKRATTSMKHKAVIAVGIAIGITLLVLSASHALRNSQSPAASSGSAIQTKAAPEFALKSPDGHTVRLSDYRGKVVLLNFWATFCAPCRVEMPTLMDLYNKYRAQGVEILGISMDDGAQERVAKFTRQLNINYPILLGNQSVADTYGGARLLPLTVFITPKGEVLQTMVGMHDRKDFEAAIETLLLMKSRD